MFDRTKLKEAMKILGNKVIPDVAVYTLIWAADDEEAQDILSAKRANFKFYDRLHRFLKSVGHGDFESMLRAIGILELDAESLEHGPRKI